MVTGEGEHRKGIHFRVGGIWRLSPDDDRNIKWVVSDLAAGDEVTIKVVETDQLNPPEIGPPKTPAERQRQQEQHEFIRKWHHKKHQP